METNSKEPLGSSDEENLAETHRLLMELNSMARDLEHERRRNRLSLSRRQTRWNDGISAASNVEPMQAPPMPPASLLQISPTPELQPPPAPPPLPPVNRRFRLSLRGQELQRNLLAGAKREAAGWPASGGYP